MEVHHGGEAWKQVWAWQQKQAARGLYFKPQVQSREKYDTYILKWESWLVISTASVVCHVDLAGWFFLGALTTLKSHVGEAPPETGDSEEVKYWRSLKCKEVCTSTMQGFSSSLHGAIFFFLSAQHGGFLTKGNAGGQGRRSSSLWPSPSSYAPTILQCVISHQDNIDSRGKSPPMITITMSTWKT